MKGKQFDNFSFKAPSSKRSESEGSIQDFPPPKIVKPSDIKFRHADQSPKVQIFSQTINTKINKISDQLEQNIKRRMQLQKKLQAVKSQEKKREERKLFLAYNHNLYKEPEQVMEKFRKIEQKADKINQMIVEKSEFKSEQMRKRQIEKNKQILLKEIPEMLTQKEKILIPIMQTLSTHKPKSVPVYTIPDQIKIQNLLRKVTFPEIPNQNLQNLRKQIQSLFAVHQPHSDIHYLLMMVYYHEGKYLKVRKHFQQIQLFKVFNPKAFWISAESEFGLENYQLCLKLTQECMNILQDKYLPRFLHLKAKSYEKLDNYINSIVCYNQLIKIKPKISEYCLERGVLYHRIGYYKEAKQDFVMFGLLNPNAQQVIKEKILSEPSEIRRKQYIAMLAKIF